MTNLYKVMLHDGDTTECIYTTTSKKSAKTLVKRAEEADNEFVTLFIKEEGISEIVPELTWIFFYDEEGLTICVEGPKSNFQAKWGGEGCYVVKATTLTKAKQQMALRLLTEQAQSLDMGYE